MCGLPNVSSTKIGFRIPHYLQLRRRTQAPCKGDYTNAVSNGEKDKNCVPNQLNNNLCGVTREAGIHTSVNGLARRTTTTSTEDALAGVLMDAISKGDDQDLSPQTVLHPSARLANGTQVGKKEAPRTDAHAPTDNMPLNDIGLDLRAMLAATGQDLEALHRSGMKLSPVRWLENIFMLFCIIFGPNRKRTINISVFLLISLYLLVNIIAGHAVGIGSFRPYGSQHGRSSWWQPCERRRCTWRHGCSLG